MSDYPELKKLGQALIGFAILGAAIFLRWQCVKDDPSPFLPPPIVVAPALPDMSPPMPSPEEIQGTLEHMQRTIEQAAREERRHERKKKRKTMKYGVQWEGEPPP